MNKASPVDVPDHSSHLSQAKKDASQIFNNLLRRQIGTRWPTVEYLTSKPEVVFTALKGYVVFASAD